MNGLFSYEKLGLENIKNVVQLLDMNPENAQTIAHGTDFDAITEIGSYKISSEASAGTMVNCPTKSAARLLVSPSQISSRRFQILIGTLKSDVHIRSFVMNGSSVTWQPWHHINSSTNPPPMVTFIDDDGATSFMREMLPLIETYNVSISCPITTLRVGTTSSGGTEFMTWEQIQSCALAGAEVLNHTYNHHPQVDDMTQPNQYTQAELELQYLKAKAALANHGIPGGDILICNNASASQPRVQAAARKTMRCSFHAGGAALVKTDTNPFYLQRYPLEPSATTGSKVISNENLENLLGGLAAQPTGWMVFCYHTDDRAWTSAHTAVIAHAIEYCNSLGLQIVTVDYGLRRYVEHLQTYER